MNHDQKLRINAPHVVHETIDGETIILNLASGTYFSLNDAGALIWSLVESRLTPQKIVEKVAARYDGKNEETESMIVDFLDELLSEGLVSAIQDGEHDSDGETARPDEANPMNQISHFDPPALNKYTDMQDLLLLDPIHDVDDSGWPAVKTN
ncbi:MAG: PqqD family protein [Desulfosarcinaceae bacterium]